MLVVVKAAGINPGEESVRKGLMHEMWPATFPSGEGTDFAGVIEELGEGVTGWEVGDEVLGFTNNRRATPNTSRSKSTILCVAQPGSRGR